MSKKYIKRRKHRAFFQSFHVATKFYREVKALRHDKLMFTSAEKTLVLVERVSFYDVEGGHSVEWD